MPPPPRHPQARDHPYTTKSTTEMPSQHQQNTSQAQHYACMLAQTPPRRTCAIETDHQHITHTPPRHHRITTDTPNWKRDAACPTIDVTCTSARRLPRGCGRICRKSSTIQSNRKNAHEKSQLPWNMQSRFWLCFIVCFGWDLYLFTWSHAAQTVFSLCRLLRYGEEKRWRSHGPQACWMVWYCVLCLRA